MDKKEQPKLITIKFKPEEVAWMKASLDNVQIKGVDAKVFAALYTKIENKAIEVGL
jgi:hypothetical protein